MTNSFLSLATAAYAGISFVPERRGHAHTEAHDQHLREMREWIEQRAPADLMVSTPSRSDRAGRRRN